MRINYFLLAEGVAQDAGGVFSAIRVGQNITISPTVPTRTKRVFFLSLRDDDDRLADGDEVTVRLRVTGPSGQVVVESLDRIQLTAKRFPDLPGEVLVPAEFFLELPEYGAYAVVADVVDANGDESTASLELHCLAPADR